MPHFSTSSRFAVILLLLLSGLLPGLRTSAQAQGTTPTYALDVAPLIYNHCSRCHHEGDIAPFPLMGYADVVRRGFTVATATQTRYMPPWKADPTYSHFLDENTLSDQQIQTIQDWFAAGMPRGDSTLEPAAPVFPVGNSALGTPDLVLPMAQKYTHLGNGQDMYRVFVLPTQLPAGRDVAAVEFRPGNRRIVHHAITAIDTTGRGRARDAAAAGYGYTQFGGFGFTPTTDNLSGYVPGTRDRFFPPGLGKKLYRNADVLVQVHYGPTFQEQTDSSVVNVFFTPQPATREVQTFPISVYSLTNGPFVLPANQVKTFHARFTVPADISALSVLPHCHLLGRSWKAWAVKPGGDTIPLIKIDDWNFAWQGSYRFPNLLRLPAGTQVFVDATYDNTAANPLNPFSPPRQVTWGDQTTAEMFVFYFDVVPYQPGDELIPLGVEANLPAGLTRPATKLYPVYPNPADAATPPKAGFVLAASGPVSLTLTDAQGRAVRTIYRREALAAGPNTVTLPTAGLAPGLYLLRLETAGGAFTQRVLHR